MTRLRMFMHALADLGVSTEILFFAPEAEMEAYGDAAKLRRDQSAYWGVEVAAVHVTPMRSRREHSHVSYYLAPLRSAASHPFFRAYCGPVQIAAVRTLLREAFDLVIVVRLAAMMPVLGAGIRLRGLLFDLCDVEHRARLRALATPPFWPGKFAEMPAMLAVHRAERQGAARARLTTVCAEGDRHYLATLGVKHVRVVANAVSVPIGTAAVPAAQTLLFLGNFGHSPNVEAIAWLAREVWPLICRRLPRARLLVAGHPASVPQAVCAGQERVDVLGFVPDLDQLYSSTRVVCCPVLQGGGTRLKLVEAAAYGRAIVSTTVGAEGLSLRHGSDVEIADSPEAFADACVRLLTDDGACARMAKAARDWAVRNGDASLVVDQIKELVRQVAAE